MSKNGNIFRDARAAIAKVARSSRGKDILTYLTFVCVAFLFWCFLSLEAETQKSIDIPLEIENVPDSVIFITATPSHINAVVHAKGTQLIRYQLTNPPSIKLKFSEFNDIGKSFIVSKEKLDAQLRNYFGHGIQIVSSRPDSLRLNYTDLPGMSVKIKYYIDAQPDIQHIINGPIKVSPTSVMVYSTTRLKKTPIIEAEPLTLTNLTDTTTATVKIIPIPGLRIIPDRIQVTIPVEPLITKKRPVAIDVKNVPENARLITFPSVLDVTYLVPMSMFNDDTPIKISVDYHDITPSSSKVKVSTNFVPDLYRNVTLSQDSIEFVIEQ